MIRVLSILYAAALLLATEGSIAAEISAPGSTTSQTNNQQIYQVTGLVVEVKPEEKSVKIKHDEVPGYMKAMTMFFDVKDTNELAGIEAGDPVSFRMIVTETYGWIEQIKKTGPKRNDAPTTGPLRLVQDVEPLQVGDPLPSYQFTNQFGQPFDLARLRGKAIAINFLFTRCPFPTFCPQTARYFAQTQEKLSTMTNSPTNWHLLTISFDPEYDTPAVLKSYAQSYNYNSERWTFATGALIDITAIAEQFGLTFYRDEPGGLPNHSLRTVIVDATGRVQRIIAGNEWKPDELVAEIVTGAKAKGP
jgi:protein SCO1